MMSRKSAAALIAALVSVACIRFVAAQDKTDKKDGGKKAAVKTDKEKAQPALCPVSGEAVNFHVNTSTSNGMVYFCCPHCVKKFDADPKKYDSKVQAQRKALKALTSVQVACPVSGEAVNGKTKAKIDGQEVQFCCEKCIPKYKEDPAKYQKKLAEAMTYQATCPVSGKPIDPAACLTNKDGSKIYFCCGRCESKFQKDPSPYLGKLEAQGYPYEKDDKGVKAKKSM